MTQSEVHRKAAATRSEVYAKAIRVKTQKTADKELKYLADIFHAFNECQPYEAMVVLARNGIIREARKYYNKTTAKRIKKLYAEKEKKK